jgi:hypothetical protein
MRNSILALLTFAVLALTGCNATLDPTGVYHGDKSLEVAEATLPASYAVIDAFLKWEMTNRALVSPEVTAFADSLRRQYPQWNDTAVALIEAYKANPTPDNRLNAQKALTLISAAVAQAATYLAQPANSATR